MRTRAVIGGLVASATVLVIGWQLGTSASTGAGLVSAPSSSGSGTYKDGSYTGTAESTQFGTVQVQVTVAGGAITDVKALQLTDDGGRSVQISNYAAPILRSEVLKAQSAKVATVSGATYTTNGYLSSVQSALDQASA